MYRFMCWQNDKYEKTKLLVLSQLNENGGLTFGLKIIFSFLTTRPTIRGPWNVWLKYMRELQSLEMYYWLKSDRNLMTFWSHCSVWWVPWRQHGQLLSRLYDALCLSAHPLLHFFALHHTSKPMYKERWETYNTNSWCLDSRMNTISQLLSQK